MEPSQALAEITRLLSMTNEAKCLTPICQEAIAARDRGDWTEALRLIRAEVDRCRKDPGPCAGAIAQALAVQGSVWQALGDWEEAQAAYYSAHCDFRARGHTRGMIVTQLALGLVHEMCNRRPQAQAAYQTVGNWFHNTCGPYIRRDDQSQRRWCQQIENILNARARAVQWISCLESASAGPPRRHATQSWQPIELLPDGRVRIAGSLYQPRTLEPRARPLALDPALAYFVATADGDSMDGGDVPIHDGDRVLARSHPRPDHGRIVVVETGDEAETTAQIKRIRYQGAQVILESANSRYKPQPFELNDPGCRILGIVLAALDPIANP